MRQLFDVEAARGHFSRHERHNLVGFEVSQRPHARTLALVAMDGGRTDTRGLELL
jgi:hypothetical protein